MSLEHRKQKGMALLASLVFLLLLSFIGLSAMGSAGQQEKMAGSVRLANQSLQVAETALRVGESQLEVQWPGFLVCSSSVQCAPPREALTRTVAGGDSQSGVLWVQVTDGLYGIQNLGLSQITEPKAKPAQVYRVTGIGLRGQSRTVLETIYVRYPQASDGAEAPIRQHFRRIMWRQIQ